MEQRTKYRGFYMVLSVVLSIILWMYVGGVVNPTGTTTIRNLPVTLVGREALESRGLMITSGADQTVTVRATGRRDALNILNSNSDTAISITVDVSSIDQPGQYTRDVQVSFNSTGLAAASSVPALTDRYPDTITINVVRQATRTIPVQGSVTGSVAKGYQAGEFSFDPDQIEVKGEESVVNQISHALVTLTEEDMTATYSGELPYTFVTFTGGIIDPAEVETGISLVRTTLPVFQLKEVPLTVTCTPGGGAKAENAEVDIVPKSVIVSGAPADLEPLKEISLGNIDLNKVLGSETLTFPINLSSEFTNVSGITEATVTVTITGLTTATVEVDSIELIHVPEGYNAEAVTQSRQVQIRGTDEAVEAVTSSQLYIVADLDNAVASTGSQTIPVKVYLNSGSDVGVVGEYNIVISITRDS